MKKIELLAPAGDIECLKAAVQAGCDAVYLGGYMYGARSFANNFSNEELVEAVKYCHLYGVKVYVTVNTLIYDDEVETFINYIDFLHRNNVDAVIIQDLGMLDLIRQVYPNLEVHGSTQMHVHNLDGVKFLENFGVKRVVLARELDIDTIRKIKKNVNIEIEVFGHGALCICYSGQCLMSSLIGNRSGNRGTCVQCCRKPYDLYTSDGKKLNVDKYLLSTKDLNTLERIDEFIEAGIDSLKIEGRMKSKEYVYFVISLYRKAIDSYYDNKKFVLDDEEVKKLKTIFNREFTKGYLFNENSINIINEYRPNHVGIKLGKVIEVNNNKIKIKLFEDIKQDDGIRIIGSNDVGCKLTYIYKNGKLVNSAFKNEVIEIKKLEGVKKGDIVLKTQSSEVKKEVDNILVSEPRKVFIDCFVKAKRGENLELVINDGINKIAVKSDVIVEKAKNMPLSKEIVIKQISKLGGTIYFAKNIDVDIDDDVFVNIKDINNIRREAIEKLNKKRIYSIPYLKKEYNCNLEVKNVEKIKAVQVYSIDAYNRIKNEDYDIIYVDYKIFDRLKIDKRVIKFYPRVFGNYVSDKNCMIGEIGGLNKCFDFITDFSFNVTNSYTVAFLIKCGATRVTLSPELDLNRIEKLNRSFIERYKYKPNLEVITEGRYESMITKYDIYSKYGIENDAIYLQDEFCNHFDVVKRDYGTVIYHYKDIDINNLCYGNISTRRIITK